MKKIYIPIVIMLLALSIHSSAQLNYLFSAEKKAYVPVRGGTTPHLVSDNAAWEVEDEGFAKVPIGFNFNYDGENFTNANVHVNGFITFKDSLDIYYPYPYFFNNLMYYPLNNKRPVIAAFWDDLLLTDTLNLVYKTTGHAPFRVFTIEWKKVKWVYESLAPVLSIELKLYETTNVIEFHYKDEGALPDARFAFASIGITSSYVGRGFISLQNTSSYPAISMLKTMDSLTVKPANNQVYRFKPGALDIPAPLANSISYTNKTVSFDLDADRDGRYHRDNEDGQNRYGHHGRHDSYEYAITRSPIAPDYGRKSFSSDVTISSLSPATTYYLYARAAGNYRLYSQWTCDSFTTAVNPVSQPYHVSGNPAAGTPLPSAGSVIPYEMRRLTFMDTTLAYYDGYNGWSVVTDFPHAGDTTLWGLNFDVYNANDWIFTPGIKLFAGKTYQVRFGYLSYYLYNPGDPASIEVKYGKGSGVGGMTKTLFAKTAISTFENYDEFGGLPLTDTVIEIRPARTDNYYFGFHNLSLLTGGVSMISNFSVSEKADCESPLVALKGNTNESDNVLNWNSSGNIQGASFEVEKSTNGKDFKTIGAVNGDARSANRKVGKPGLRIDKNAAALNVGATGKENSKKLAAKYIEKSRPRLVIQKNNVPHLAKTDKKLDYTDCNVQGTNYYRLRLTDKNGKISYSNIITLKARAISLSRVYPNPALTTLSVELTSPEAGKVNLVVTDINGKTLINKPAQVWPGANNLQVQLGNLPAGSYIIKVICTNGCESSARKFIKE